MRRFELSEGTSHKFWQVERDGSTMRVNFGRIGTNGQLQEKSFATPEAAQAEVDRLVREKVKKGYAEVGAAPAPAVAPVTKKPPPEAPPKRPEAVPEGDHVAWTPAALAAAAPMRGRDLVPPVKLDAKALYERLAKVMRAREPMFEEAHRQKLGNLALTDAARAAFAGKPPPSSLDEEAQAAAYALIGPKLDYGDPGREDTFVLYWAAVEGPLFALRTWLRAWPMAAYMTDSVLVVAKTPPNDLPWFRREPQNVWRGLRTIVAQASAEEHAALVAHARAYRNEELQPRALLAVAFEAPDWVASELPLAGGRRDVPIWPLAASFSTIEEAEALLASAVKVSWAYAHGLSPVRFDVVARFGTAASRLLLHGLEHREAGVDRVRELGEALALIVTPEVAAFFVDQLDSKELRGIAADYLRAHPAPALPKLATLAAGKGSAAETAKAVLRSIVATAPEVVASAALPESVRTVIERLEAATAIAEEAPAEELPEVLRTPPWTVKVKATPAKVLELATLARPETIAWRPGEQEKLLRAHWVRHHTTADHAARVRAISAAPMKQDPWGRETAQIFTALSKDQLLALLPEIDLTKFRWDSYWPVAHTLLAMHGPELVAFALRTVPFDGVAAVQALARVDSPRVAPVMADALTRLKKVRPIAAEWFTTFPKAAATGLIPLATGKPGKPREAAGAALRLLSSKGHRTTIEEVAAEYGALDDVRAVLDFDARRLFPSRLPSLPSFWNPAAFARPLLRSGKALPLAAVDALGTMLAFTSLDEPYPGIADVKEACEPKSLGAFSWDLFQAWLVAGAPSKEQWALLAMGLLGDDECARRLTPLVRSWPGEAAHARAVTALDVLAGIGTDVALMHLHGIAQKVKFKGLQEKARLKIDQLAEARGLTADELADRLVPDLDLDEDGSRVLDFGPRSFRVVFDELLKPGVRDEAGKRLPELPKAKATDDADKAREATEIWKALRKDAKTISSGQILRLELAMCARRRWTPDVFRQFLVAHPLLVHVVRRLVWGLYDADERLVATFRVAEDRTLADANEDTFELPAEARIGIVHRLDLDEATAAAWGQVFADYELLQPFAQLSRETTAPTDEERRTHEIVRVEGLTIPTGKVLGLDGRGWRRGPPQDGGVVCWYEKPIARDIVAVLDLDPGIYTGMVSESPEQKLGKVMLTDGEGFWAHERKKALAELGPVAFSELLRDLESLRP